MKLFDLHEMAKAISAKTCGKCSNDIVDRNYYYYKGQYFHKGGCPAAGTTPSAPSQPGAAATPAAPRQVAPRPAPVSSGVQKITEWLNKHDVTNFSVDPTTGAVDVTGNVMLDVDNITQLPVKFGRVTGSFSVGGSDLTTLEGCPTFVGKTFNCRNTDITDFTGGPQEVGGSYTASNNAKLTSLQGLPRIVPGTLDLSGKSQLKTLDGISEQMGSLSLPSSPISCKGIHKLVKKVRNIVAFNSDPKTSSHWLGVLFIEGLRDGVEVSQDRRLHRYLNAVLDIRGKEVARDPDAEPPLPYRDVLDVQEKLIDAGYSRIAKL